MFPVVFSIRYKSSISHLCVCLADITALFVLHEAIRSGKPDEVLHALHDEKTYVKGVRDEVMAKYQNNLRVALAAKVDIGLSRCFYVFRAP